MSKMSRFGSALSVIAVAAVLAGCASPLSKRSAGVGTTDSTNLALATRAHVALNARDYEAAVGFAERAVEAKPQDAVLRTLLGNAYLASGRFASAESAFRDSLSLRSNQPDVILKLALVMIAQGRGAEARSFLDAGAGFVDRADYGLALALAGWPAEAALILEQAARQFGADARVRQNLALSHALAGDWESARVVASQDLPAGLVDSRIQEWMALATPSRPADQVAALTGITPAPYDPGQPHRLALSSGGERLAAVAEPVPQAAPEPAPQMTYYYPPAIEPVSEPVVPAATPALAPAPAPAPVMVAAPVAEPPAVEHALTNYSPPAPQFEAPTAPKAAAAPVKPVRSVRVALPPAKPAPAATARGTSNSVVQLGAYGSPQRVEAAWNQIARRHGSLRNYTPASARFDGPTGTVYRLSVKGFTSDRQARETCEAIRRQGANCFVRTMAGDSPVRFASR